MFGSVRKRNQLTSIVLGLLPINSPSSLLSSEAFFYFAQRPHKSRTSAWRNILRHCSGYQIHRTECFLTERSVSDTEIYSDLALRIRESYERKETDGILELAVSSSMMIDLGLDIENTLIPAILNASEGNKGVTASIMNALIGSTCILSKSINAERLNNYTHFDEQNLRLISERVLLLMEALRETGGIQPDIVTYSLIYRALSMNPEFSGLANSFLEEAEKKSKKTAGGKRRKLLASARRRKISTYFEAEDSLRGILGEDFKILLETDDFAVINKPSGVPCFHKKRTTAGKMKRGKGKNGKGGSKRRINSSDSVDISLEDALITCNVDLSTLNPESFGLVHRLDRGSSGCLVLAKSNKIHARLIAEFFLRNTTKKYVALVQESSISSLPVERCGLIENPVYGRPARSMFTILERYESFFESEYEGEAALVEFEIYTGRKHQIRVHAAEVLGSPVRWDPLYSNANDNGDSKRISSDSSGRIFLHARNLVIPDLGINVESALPTWWQSTLSRLKRKET